MAGKKRPLRFPAPQDLFDVALDLYARQHNFMPAALAADLEIHADTQHIKTVGTAGVRFLGLDHIADLYIHGSTPPFLKSVPFIIVHHGLFCKPTA